MRRHGDRMHLGREHEVDDREVVWRQVPEDVDVLLDQAEVRPDRVDVIDLAELARAHELAERLDRRGETERVIGHHDEIPRCRLGDDLPTVFDSGGERLLDQYVTACVEGLHGQREVRLRRGRDRYRLDAFICECLREVARDLHI